MESENTLEEIMRAFHADDAGAVRGLLEQHPEIRARINEKVGPLDSPAINSARSREMLDVLLDAGADINAKSDWWAGGFAVLHSASPDVAAYAIERGAVVDVHAAARLGMLDKLRELVALNPESVHARGGDGQTALHFASSVEIAAFLLEHGAEIDALDVDHESTPAQWMVDERQDVARYLISRDCKTDILMATAVGDIDLVRRHLDDDPESIRMLVSDDYFPMIGGKTGGTIYQWALGWYVSPHQVARKFGRDEILQLLLERSPAPVKLLDACWMKDEETARLLRSQHPTIADEFTDQDRCHAAHAARNNETEAVRLLLDSGIPVDGKSQHLGTPLHWAAFHGNLEMTNIILGHVPPLEVKDRDFKVTPLNWAIYGSEHGWFCETGDYAGTVEALIQAGAKPPDTIGGSPAVQETLRRLSQVK